MDKARILVVEDELPIQTLIAFNLQEAGFDVCCAQNVQAASDILRARLPDLMVLDWMLPDCDGVSWIAELRRQAATAALPIILLTARRTGLCAGRGRLPDQTFFAPRTGGAYSCAVAACTGGQCVAFGRQAATKSGNSAGNGRRGEYRMQ